MTEVRTAEEFIEALQRKDDEIRITGGYCAEIAETVKSNVAGVTTEYVNFTVGGATAILSYLLESMAGKIKKEPKDLTRIKQRLLLYKLTQFSPEEICLRLMQLDY